MTERVCKQCGKPLGRRQKSFCSYGCANEALRDRVEYTCRYCGRVFSLKPSQAKMRAIEGICSVECGLRWSEPIVRKMLADGLALITVDNDSVRCEICGTRLRTMGSHMQSHGVQTSGMCHLERNIALGLKAGQRAMPSDMLSKVREDALKHNRLDRFPRFSGCVADTKRTGQLWSMVKLSDLQLRNLRFYSAIHHEEACRRKTAIYG